MPEQTIFSDEEGGDGIEAAPPISQVGRKIVTQPYDFPVFSLVDQIKAEKIVLQDIHQRKYVWDETKQSRLIESLILNIPLPVCYFAEDDESEKFIVVDGHQRLGAIYNFVEKRAFKLKNLQVLSELNGKGIDGLDRKHRAALTGRTIRCIVITKDSDPSVRFDIFERLNTQPVPLNAQELRNCVYRGTFNRSLRARVGDGSWLHIIGEREEDERMRDCELILRFFALHDSLEKYRPPMKQFLNDYMRQRKDPPPKWIAEKEMLLRETVEKVRSVFDNRAFRQWQGDAWEKTINRAVFDTVMITLASVPSEIIKTHAAAIEAGFKALSVDPDFKDAVSKATGDRTRLRVRLAKMETVLADVGVTVANSARIAAAQE